MFKVYIYFTFPDMQKNIQQIYIEEIYVALLVQNNVKEDRKFQPSLYFNNPLVDYLFTLVRFCINFWFIKFRSKRKTWKRNNTKDKRKLNISLHSLATRYFIEIQYFKEQFYQLSYRLSYISNFRKKICPINIPHSSILTCQMWLQVIIKKFILNILYYR